MTPTAVYTLGGCFVVVGQLWAMLYSFSVLHSEITSAANEYYTAWIFSAMFGGVMLCSLPVTWAIRRIGMRTTHAAACLLASSAVLLTSFITDYRLWFLTLTAPYSLAGAAFQLLPYMTVVYRFPQRISFSCSFISTGSGVFQMALPPAWQSMLRHMSIKHSLWVLAAFLFSLIIFTPIFPTKQLYNSDKRVKDPNRRGSVDLDTGELGEYSEVKTTRVHWRAAIRKRSLIIITVCCFVHFALNTVPIVPIVYYANSLFPHRDNSLAVTVMALGAIVGRLIAGYTIDRFSIPVTRMYQVLLMLYGTGQSILSLCRTYKTVLLACTVIGLGDAMWAFLYPLVLEVTFPCRDDTLYAIFLVSLSVPYMMGGAIATWINILLDSYIYAFLLGSLVYLSISNVLWVIRFPLPSPLSHT